ncbi:MAG: hypothetical protein ABJN40_05995 [Sneathiella sp.]
MVLDSTPKENEAQADGLDENVSDPSVESIDPNDANTVESSATNDEDAKEPTTLLDAVTAAIEEDKAAEAPSSLKENGEDAEGSAAKSDEDDNPPFHEHPRWKELISERDTFKQSHHELIGLKNYMTNAGLSSQEVNVGFEVMRDIKSNPARALKTLMPYINQLEQITGVTLSPDIQERVNEGYLDEGSAKELARLRSQAQLATAASEQAVAHARQLQDSQQRATHADNVSSAVSDWEGKWSESDPDYKLKQPKVMEKIELQLLKNGPPQTREEAVQMVEDCRRVVDAELALFRPPKNTVRNITGGSSPKSTPEPTSLLEAMQQGLARTS